VIEKCLTHSTPEYKKKFVKEVIKSDRIVELMKNKYGNFVILKILQTTEPEDKTAVMQSLLKNVNAVNVIKYKNRWLQFIEENPMKIPGMNQQTVKPSIFKNTSNSPHLSSEGNLSREGSDNDTNWQGEDWNDPKQQQQQPGGKKRASKEEKSQFYSYKNTKPPGTFMPGDPQGYEGFGFNPQMNPEGRFEANQGFGGGMNERFHDDREQNTGFGKRNANYSHQKPYTEKQNPTNKRGYNNFY
jgi:hypothetical protein